MTAPTVMYTITFGCLAIFYYLSKRHFANKRRTLPLPPGPPGLPWVGNVVGIDTRAPWATFHEWAKTYGGLVYFRLLGKDIIIVNSEKIAKDLLDKSSSNYSDRPHLITSDLCGIGFGTAFLPYGDRWRLHRQFLHQTFRIGSTSRFLPFQRDKACQLLRGLFNTPEQFSELIFRYTGSIILHATYNYDTQAQIENDGLFSLVAKVQDIALSVVRPEIAAMIDTFPALLKLPAWFPGMSFKDDMKMSSKLAREYVNTAYEHGLQKVRNCNDVSFMVCDALRGFQEKGIVPDEARLEVLKEACASAFLAASETSHTFLMTFLLMMLLNPEVQEKAQAQIDVVVGKARLPTIGDRTALPYTDAIVRETFRYHPTLPLSIPHAVSASDVFDGYHIPKEAIIMTNLWSMAHDESRYPNPHSFIPERFLNEDGSLKPNDTENIAFGFGRRICVGRHFADSSVWSVIANVLAIFKILKPVDENGVDILVEDKFLNGLVSRPHPFRCRIVPRIPGMDAEKLEQLIAASAV